MNKILLYGHGGAYNHGAEAIVRSSLPMFQTAGVPILLSTHFPEQDREFGLDKLVDRLIPADLAFVPEERSAVSFEEKERVASRIYRNALAEIDHDTVCVGIGGDNYCYPNWHRQSVFHRTVKALGGKSVLWGCSIQPDLIDERMAKIFREHDRIYTREGLTAAALRGHGVTQLTEMPDPAFLLPPEPVTLPERFHGTVAAINLSPLILRYSKKTLTHFIETARFLLSKVDSLLMISHVTMPMDNDEEALSLLAKNLSALEQSRLCWVPKGLNAAQRKYLISKCELLVCCRTHASIAGYSSGVPTLVVGYSVKSQGIGADLSMDHLVLPYSESQKLPILTSELWDNRTVVADILLKRINQNKFSMLNCGKVNEAN